MFLLLQSPFNWTSLDALLYLNKMLFEIKYDGYSFFFRVQNNSALAIWTLFSEAKKMSLPLKNEQPELNYTGNTGDLIYMSKYATEIQLAS